MNESDLKKKIKKLLPKNSWSFAPVQTGMGEGGIPDRIVCIPYTITLTDVGKTLGLFVGIEAKMDRNKLTKLQTSQLKSIVAAGGKALVVRGQKKRGLPFTVEEIKID